MYKRLQNHIYALRSKSKDENRHLINSWNKYGEDCFECYALEYLEELNENLLKVKELYWIKKLNSINREKGYNLRMDSSTNMIVHEETKELLSKLFSGENNPNYNNKWSDEKSLNFQIKLKNNIKMEEKE